VSRKGYLVFLVFIVAILNTISVAILNTIPPLNRQPILSNEWWSNWLQLFSVQLVNIVLIYWMVMHFFDKLQPPATSKPPSPPVSPPPTPPFYPPVRITHNRYQLIERLHNWNRNVVFDALAQLRQLGALIDGSLDGINLQGINLQNADLRHARLTNVNLQNTILIGANLQWADLRGADLRGANLAEARLYGADISGCRVDHNTIMPDGTRCPNGASLLPFTQLHDDTNAVHSANGRTGGLPVQSHFRGDRYHRGPWHDNGGHDYAHGKRFAPIMNAIAGITKLY